ncbi:MAG TPA: hypothetical protein VFK43_22655 [Acidimicrobiales bacterium]|nr:hypothetical protein [Acidimicrobiales bacterium]
MPPSTSPPTTSPSNAIDDFFDGLEELLGQGTDDFEDFSEAVNDLIAGLFG